MVKISELAARLAAVDGRPPEVLEHFVRRLREGGLVPNVGRGKPAEHATLRDAASLLLALNGADNARDAVRHVQQYRDMVPFNRPVVSQEFRSIVLTEAVGGLLEEQKTFGDALAMLISSMPVLLPFWIGLFALGRHSEDVADWQKAAALGTAGVQVELARICGDWPHSALIRIWHRGEADWVVDYEQKFGRDGIPENEFPSSLNVDREITSKFGTRTLAAVSDELMKIWDKPPAGT